MNTNKTLLVCLASTVLIALPAKPQSQTLISVSGKVTSTLSGGPVIGADIRAKSSLAVTNTKSDAKGNYRLTILSAGSDVVIWYAEASHQRIRRYFEHNPMNVVLNPVLAWSNEKWKSLGVAAARKDLAEVSNQWAFLEIDQVPTAARVCFAKGLLEGDPKLKGEVIGLDDFATVNHDQLDSFSSSLTSMASDSLLDPAKIARLNHRALPASIAASVLRDHIKPDGDDLDKFAEQLNSLNVYDPLEEIYLRAGASVLKQAALRQAASDSKALTPDQQVLLNSTVDVLHSPVKNVIGSVIDPSTRALKASGQLH